MAKFVRNRPILRRQWPTVITWLEVYLRPMIIDSINDGVTAAPSASYWIVWTRQDVNSHTVCPSQHLVDQCTNGAERVIFRHTLLRGHVTEHRIRLAVVSSHAGHGSTRSTICRSPTSLAIS